MGCYRDSFTFLPNLILTISRNREWFIQDSQTLNTDWQSCESDEFFLSYNVSDEKGEAAYTRQQQHHVMTPI
jgi:hypothetical protein